MEYIINRRYQLHFKAAILISFQNDEHKFLEDYFKN